MGRDGDGVSAASETSIEITFTYRGQRCRERIKLKPTAANLKRANRFREAILDAIERGTFEYAVTFPNSRRRLQFIERQGEAITLTSYLDRWLEDKKPRVKASTWDGYMKIINQVLIPHLGRYYLADLTRQIIRAMLIDLKVSNKRLANIQSVLRTALQDAVMDDLIETNPLYGWKYVDRDLPKVEDDIDPFTPEEQAAILGSMSGQIRNLYQFAFWTGLRTSELVALDWSHIDWKREVVKVTRAKTQIAQDFEGTKTKAGKREVRLLPPALAALKDQKAYTFKKHQEIFQDPRYGERWKGDLQLRERFWKPAIKASGVRYRRPYQTRHTYASMMLSAGEPPMWVANQMGHSDQTMIFRVYGRWIPGTEPEAGHKAVRLFGGHLENAGKKLAFQSQNSPKTPQEHEDTKEKSP